MIYNYLMVYIRLNERIYPLIKDLVQPSKLILCNKEYYLPYPEFKKIAIKHNLQIHQSINRNDIITYNNMDILIEKDKQTPEQKRFIEELKNKREVRQLKMMGSKDKSDYYFQKNNHNPGIKEITQTISFSMAFIFSFFMAGVTGYCFGSFFLNWNLAKSLMLALGFIVLTIFVETSLFILKQSKSNIGSKKKDQQNFTRPAEQPRNSSKKKEKVN